MIVAEHRVMGNRRGSVGELSNLDQVSIIESDSEKGNYRLEEMTINEHAKRQATDFSSI